MKGNGTGGLRTSNVPAQSAGCAGMCNESCIKNAGKVKEASLQEASKGKMQDLGLIRSVSCARENTQSGTQRGELKNEPCTSRATWPLRDASTTPVAP